MMIPVTKRSNCRPENTPTSSEATSSRSEVRCCSLSHHSGKTGQFTKAPGDGSIPDENKVLFSILDRHTDL